MQTERFRLKAFMNFSAGMLFKSTNHLQYTQNKSSLKIFFSYECFKMIKMVGFVCRMKNRTKVVFFY